MFYNQILQLCKQNNTSVTAVAQSLGMSKGTVTSWKNGGIPNGETILKFANYFNVSTDFLLTGKINFDSITEDEKDWISLYKELSLCEPSIQAECIGFVKGYIERGKKLNV